MSQFKAGDVVVCIDNEHYEEILSVGNEYVVKDSYVRECISGTYKLIVLEDVVSSFTGKNYELVEKRFILKQNKPEEKLVKNTNTNPNSATAFMSAIQHYTANNPTLLFSVEDGKLVVTNIEQDQRCVVESLEEAVKALTLLDNISKSEKEWDEFYEEKEHVC